MTLTEVIMKSGLTANRVYYMLARLQIRPNEHYGYPNDTIEKFKLSAKADKYDHAAYYRNKRR
ncbi:MAG: hypothetical protein GY797_33555 [Deltaproteobacteria bacterium]|nr:hypothetical protein [Deltaproteobacteria bacterium]